jgi:hypothetical protein
MVLFSKEYNLKEDSVISSQEFVVGNDDGYSAGPKFPVSTQSDCSLSCSQQPSHWSLTEPVESSSDLDNK